MKTPLLFILSFCLGLSLMSQNLQMPKKQLVKEVSERDVNYFLNLIPQGQEQEYGFVNRADFSNVEIGEVYTMYFAERKDGVVNLLKSNTFRVPVKVNGKSVALLTVKYNENGTAEIVDFGAAKLAQKLDAFESNYKSSNDRIILRNTFVKKDFIVTDLASLSSTDANGVISINSQSTSKLYPIAAGKQTAMGLSSFVNATLAAELK